MLYLCKREVKKSLSGGCLSYLIGNINKRLLLFGIASRIYQIQAIPNQKEERASVCALGMGVFYLVWWALVEPVRHG
jgi:hypothetical protein